MFDNYFTQNLKENEKLILQVKKHWASFIVSILKIFIILIIPFFLISFLFSSIWGVIIFFLWVAADIAYGIHQWLTWYFDSVIITDKRIICLDQKSLFNRIVSEISLASVQDVTYEINGFFALVFNFGILRVSTATKNVIEIKNIPNPKSLQELIFDLRQKIKKTISAQELVEILERTKKS